MSKEEWRPIEGYEELYEVSNQGRVKSLPRVDRNNRNRGGYCLKPHSDKDGYRRVCLAKSGTKKTIAIHRLVASAFIPNPDSRPAVNHINEDKTDNCVENLEWVTDEENVNYGTRNKRVSKAMIGTREGKAVLQYSKDEHLIQEFPSTSRAAKETGIAKVLIRLCCQGKAKTAGGYLWKYKK